jgi:putative transposase
MQVSRSAYYSWRSNEREPEQPDIALKVKLKALFDGSKSTYGSRRLAKELTAAGFPVG